MSRINVYDHSDEWTPPKLVGWYDSERAERWSDANHNGHGAGGVGRGEAVVRTAQGRWVLQHWTAWQGESADHEYITADEAREWLIRNDEDDAVERWFGELPEEAGPGRPEVGPRFQLRLPAEMTAEIDQRADGEGVSRAEMTRRLLAHALS